MLDSHDSLRSHAELFRWSVKGLMSPKLHERSEQSSEAKNQVPPVTEENRVAFFSSDRRPSDVAGELLFFFKRGNIDVM